MLLLAPSGVPRKWGPHTTGGLGFHTSSQLCSPPGILVQSTLFPMPSSLMWTHILVGVGWDQHLLTLQGHTGFGQPYANADSC